MPVPQDKKIEPLKQWKKNKNLKQTTAWLPAVLVHDILGLNTLHLTLYDNNTSDENVETIR